MKHRITFSLLLSVIMVSLSIAQTNTVRITKEFKGEPLVRVLNELEALTGYTFSYSSSSIETDQLVTVSLGDATISDALDKIFAESHITYEMLDQRIILKQQRVRQIIRGRVVDRHSKQSVPGASVILVDTNPLKGDASDPDGYFRIPNVETGRYTVKVTYLGYEELLIPDVLVNSAKEVVMDIELSESLLEMDEIRVGVGTISSAPMNDMAQVSARSFTVEETQRFPVSVGDPLRLVSSFPGVLSNDDGMNEIVVRGNSPRGLLWKLHGVEIPNPNHFSQEGTSSGAISMFSTQVLSRSDFLTSAFPAEYGNAVSGVFDISMRNGNNQRRESTFQLGLLGVDLASEGPLTKNHKSSYLFNYRYSTLSMLSGLGLPLEEEGEQNIFQDFSFKVNLPTEKAGTFEVFGLGGLSSYSADLEILNDEEKYNMGVVGISNTYIINNSIVMTSTLSLSGTEVADNYQEPNQNGGTYKDENSFKKYFIRGSVKLDKKFNARHFVTTGATLSYLNYNFLSRYHIPNNAPPFQDYEVFNDTGSSQSYQGFVSWKYRPHENLSFVNGIHFLHFDINDQTVVEPRSNVRWQFSPRASVFGGFGLHSRIESLEYYFGNYINADGSSTQFNNDLGVTRASHYVAGFDVNLTNRIYLKTEVYYQHLFDVPVLADTSIENSFSAINVSDGYVTNQLINGGTGDNYGIELTIEKKFSGNYYFLLNGTLYQSKYKARDGVSRNTRYNGNFGYNILAGREFRVGDPSKNKTFGANVKLAHAGNRRYTPVDLQESQQAGHEVRQVEDSYTARFPNYFRMDLQFSLRKNRQNRTVEWRLDLQNATFHNNVLDNYYEPDTNTVVQPEEVIFIPVLSYRIEF